MEGKCGTNCTCDEVPFVDAWELALGLVGALPLPAPLALVWDYVSPMLSLPFKAYDMFKLPKALELAVERQYFVQTHGGDIKPWEDLHEAVLLAMKMRERIEEKYKNPKELIDVSDAIASIGGYFKDFFGLLSFSSDNFTVKNHEGKFHPSCYIRGYEIHYEPARIREVPSD